MTVKQTADGNALTRPLSADERIALRIAAHDPEESIYKQQVLYGIGELYICRLDLSIVT